MVLDGETARGLAELSLRTGRAMEVAAGGDSKAPLASHLLEALAFAHGRRGMPGLDAVDALFEPFVHQGREAPPGDEEGPGMRDDRETAGLVDEGDALIEIDDGLGLVEGLALAEIAVEGVLPAFRGLFRDEKTGDVGAADLALGLPVLASDGLQFLHRRLDARVVHPAENARVAFGTGESQLGKCPGYLSIDAAEIEAEEMEFPGRKGDLDFDAPNEPDAAGHRLALGLGKARHRIVIGEGERRNAGLGGEGDEFRGRITSVARRTVTVQIDQVSPPRASSSAFRPKTRMGMAACWPKVAPAIALEARRAMVMRLSSSRGEVRRWGESRDCV